MAETFELAGGGQLRAEREGVFVRCEVTRAEDGRGIYKVWLTGEKGSVLLGTLAPENGVLRLCRKVSGDRLARAGCWPVTGGRCELTFPFHRTEWTREPVEQRMTDPVLRRSARGLCAPVRAEPDGFCVALPFDPCRPFALSPAFCFARIERVEGQRCAVFRFDSGGQPKREE